MTVSAHAAKWDYLATSTINWMAYGEEAFNLARSDNRPVFVFVYADWCKWCKKYEINTLEKTVIREILTEKWVPVAVNYDDHPDLSRQLGVKLVPTTLLLTPDAKKLQRFFGVVDPQSLAENLDHVISSWQRGELPRSDFGDESTCCPLIPPD